MRDATQMGFGIQLNSVSCVFVLAVCVAANPNY